MECLKQVSDVNQNRQVMAYYKGLAEELFIGTKKWGTLSNPELFDQVKEAVIYSDPGKSPQPSFLKKGGYSLKIMKRKSVGPLTYCAKLDAKTI
jgi:hypothetical protein